MKPTPEQIKRFDLANEILKEADACTRSLALAAVVGSLTYMFHHARLGVHVEDVVGAFEQAVRIAKKGPAQ